MNRTLVCALCLLICSGCFTERSHPFRDDDGVRLELPDNSAALSAREWLRTAHAQLAHLLPDRRPAALLTEDMTTADGEALDVSRHFGLRFENMDSLIGNLEGLQHTAQMASTRPPSSDPPPPWAGFEDIWIPVGDGLQLAGRIGFASDGSGATRRADCVVILPGFLGDNQVLRSRDLAVALRDAGLHAVALELRGCGRTEKRFCDIPMAWGVLETGDLLRVSEWLEDLPQVRRTGMVGFCWGANIAMLTAWADGRTPHHPSITADLAAILQQSSDRAHFSAGVLAFSPVLQFDELVEKLDRRRRAIKEPVLYAFQNSVLDRQRAKGHYPADGSLRTLIQQEAHGYPFAYPGIVEDGLRCLRLMPWRNAPAGDKLEDARVPLIIIRAANDPLVPAQRLATLTAATQNPNVAALILPGGGHVGFAAYATAYYFNLILNFFDPRVGPQAVEGFSH